MFFTGAVQRIDMWDDLDISAGKVPWEPFAPCANPKLAFGDVDQFQPCF